MSWTEDELDKLRIYWNEEDKRSPEIAKLLGKTPAAVISKIKVLRQSGIDMVIKSRWSETEISKLRKLEERICLRCRKPFLSNNRFNKICRKCNIINSGVHSASIMSLI